MASNLLNQVHPPSELDAKVPYAYVHQLWTDCLEDCARDEVKARQQYTKIVSSVARQLKHQRSAPNSPSPSDDSSQQDSESDSEDASTSNSESETKRRRVEDLKWEKPGALSRRVGIKQSVLRTLANAEVVQTMLSPGGHRWFNVASVMQYIASTTKNSKNKKRRATVANKLPSDQRQLLVYVRLHGADQSPAQLEAVSDRIRSQVLAHYKDSCTQDELESCIYIFELDSDQPGHPVTVNHLSNTAGMRRLLKSICNRDQARSLVVLRSTDDVSSEPSTYSFFHQLCRNMNVSVDIVPELSNSI